MLLRYRLGDAERMVRLEHRSAGFRVTLDVRSFDVDLIRSDGSSLHLRIDGRPVEAIVVPDRDRCIVKIGEADPVTLLRPERQWTGGGPSRASDGRLTAVMDGQVVAVMVKPGERVESGTPLVVLEAMKMEMKGVAPFPGRGRSGSVRPGGVV